MFEFANQLESAMTSRLLRHVLLFCSLGILVACAHLPSAEQRKALAQSLITAQGWQWKTLKSDGFSLFMAAGGDKPHIDDEITIYLEGDGLAWLSMDTPSDDPTPLDPVALRLAMRQPDGRAIYLGRPCQYAAEQMDNCSRALWTNARFSEVIAASLDGAVSQIKANYKARRVNLVGYSGGAALAMLLAERRNDVHMLVSVAGNVDPTAWVRLHGLSPLRGSLDPLGGIGTLRAERLLLLNGGNDTNIPPILAEELFAKLRGTMPVTSRTVPGFDHRCCWEAAWPALWHDALQDAPPVTLRNALPH